MINRCLAGGGGGSAWPRATPTGRNAAPSQARRGKKAEPFTKDSRHGGSAAEEVKKKVAEQDVPEKIFFLKIHIEQDKRPKEERKQLGDIACKVVFEFE